MRYYGFGRVWFILIFMLALAIALPVLIHAVEAIIPAVILFCVLLGIGSLLYQRRRRW